MALKAYLHLTAKDKLRFLAEVNKIEKMHAIVRQDYCKTLLSIVAGGSSMAKDGVPTNISGV